MALDAQQKKIGKIVVDRQLCIGAATCVVMAGDVFELDNENKAIIKRKKGKRDSGPATRADLEGEGVTDEQLLLAAQSCPTKAIALYDEEGKQIYP